MCIKYIIYKVKGLVVSIIFGMYSYFFTCGAGKRCEWRQGAPWRLQVMQIGEVEKVEIVENITEEEEEMVEDDEGKGTL